MTNNKTDCRKFENCELVIAGLSNPDELIRRAVQNCLFYLYGEDCAKWLSKTFGKNPSGIKDQHNGFQAFEDAFMALEFSIRQNRFKTQGRSNACRTFLYSVATRCFIRLENKKKVKTIDISEVEDTSIYSKAEFEYALEQDEKMSKIHEIIKGMPEKCREILWLYFIEGLKTSEIAVRLGITVEQVRKRLFDCRNNLRKIFPFNFNENY